MTELAHYRQAHPLPYVITHWINLIAVGSLIVSGFLIHYPFIPRTMAAARGVHVFFAAVFVVNMLVRVVSAFFVKSAVAGGTREVDLDIKNFLPQKDNRHQMGAWIRYYLFLKKDHPLGAKFGVLQKIFYFMIPVFALFMTLTGFCLWAPTGELPPMQAIINMAGGIMMVRIAHYWLMWLFIIFLMIHIYLSVIEGLSPLKMMFFWKEHGGLVYSPKVHDIVGEDEDLTLTVGEAEDAEKPS